jgi:hypothetical protein
MTDVDTRLTRDQWERRRSAHAARVRPWVEDRLHRAARGEKHPVYDFLFEYYAFRPAHLRRWSPGVGVFLEDASPDATDWPRHFRQGDRGVSVPADSFPPLRVRYLEWAIRYSENVAARPPAFGCYGLHEWAMVYRTDAIRHSRVPLRVTPDEIAGVVESQGLRCTHFDAYRFFSPAARPRNRLVLTRADTSRHDQPGCIHANMDLYKLAYTIAPYSSSELIADAFLFAIAAREIDMRASPYDLRSSGFSPIVVETKAGRDEYSHEQQQLASKADVLRIRVLEAYRRLHDLIRENRVDEKTPDRSCDRSGVSKKCRR